MRLYSAPWIEYCIAVQYEPELFPGLIYRMKEPKVVLLIFVSGKVVLTGVPAVQSSMCLPTFGCTFLYAFTRPDSVCPLSAQVLKNEKTSSRPSRRSILFFRNSVRCVLSVCVLLRVLLAMKLVAKTISALKDAVGSFGHHWAVFTAGC